MNIGEIARRSGVSRSTVSYALSGKRPVSKETRRRIQAVIDELGYRPNATAKALKEGRTRTIALVIPPASRRLTDVQLGFVASVVDAAGRADLDVLLSPSGGEHERSFERVIGGRRVDGDILMEIRLEDDRVTRLRQTGLPFVVGVAARHLAENLHPPLTAADMPADELGSHAVELLIERIADPAAAHRNLLLAPPISLRGTTAPARPPRLPALLTRGGDDMRPAARIRLRRVRGGRESAALPRRAAGKGWGVRTLIHHLDADPSGVEPHADTERSVSPSAGDRVLYGVG
ncbi:LacI family DNA-binding transcriptional regulator [Nonomuraea sp. NPDC049141]|uniref:LacI family DNA-binding transcriptional regulator n=1 Tax=Nonomuraea sp. NPDC049141 TaxID=3155500 RepID=UPI00340E4278